MKEKIIRISLSLLLMMAVPMVSYACDYDEDWGDYEDDEEEDEEDDEISWGVTGSNSNGFTFDDFVFTASSDDDDKEPQEPVEPQEPEEPEENYDPCENGDCDDTNDNESNDPDPDPKPTECQGEKCEICGGYKSSGVMFRSTSPESCPACTCGESNNMPNCEEIGDAVSSTINNYPLTLNEMRQYVGEGGCVLLYDDESKMPKDNKDIELLKCIPIYLMH